MRILHVNKFLHRRGGAETYMLDVAALQQRAGHEVAFFGMAHPDNPPSAHDACFPPYIELDPPPPGVAARIRAAGRMVYSRASRAGMERVLADFAPDVVHLHNIYHQLSPSILRPLAASGVRTVMTLHDYKLACPSYLLLDHGRVCDACVGGSLLNPVRRRCKAGSLTASALLAAESAIHRATHAYEPVQAFVCPSRFCADVMRRAGVYPDRLTVVPNFVDATAMPVKDRPGGEVVYAGRLSHEKGVDTLIDALGRLPSVVLQVAGTGPLLEQLRRHAAHVASGRVRFHGHLSRPRLFDLVQRGGAVAVPSRCQENQPLGVLEAFACGVPVVATALGGLPELVGEERGVLVPPDHPDALAATLRRLLADRDATFAMGRRAREYVEREHAPDAHLRRLEAVYAVPSSTVRPGPESRPEGRHEAAVTIDGRPDGDVAGSGMRPDAGPAVA